MVMKKTYAGNPAVSIAQSILQRFCASASLYLVHSIWYRSNICNKSQLVHVVICPFCHIFHCHIAITTVGPSVIKFLFERKKTHFIPLVVIPSTYILPCAPSTSEFSLVSYALGEVHAWQKHTFFSTRVNRYIRPWCTVCTGAGGCLLIIVMTEPQQSKQPWRRRAEIMSGMKL